MSDIDTAALRALREAGTAGEWDWDSGWLLLKTPVRVHIDNGDLELVAAAVNALVPLCDEVDDLQGEVERLRAEVAEAEIGGFLLPRPPICASAFGDMPADTTLSVSSSRGMLSYEIRFDVPTADMSPAEAFDRAIKILSDAKGRLAR